MLIDEPVTNDYDVYKSQVLIVIVLYNATLTESNAYQSIADEFSADPSPTNRVDLVVINNGPRSINCPVDDIVFRLHYIEQLDNPGVSKAYNLASQLASRLQKQWLLLFDQDTTVPAYFWNHYCQSIRDYPAAPVHAPRLWSGNTLISPCKYRFYRGQLLAERIHSGLHKINERNVLNSGLLVRLDSFLAVGGYNESVRLYFSDFTFFDRIKTRYTMFAVVDADLAHSLSSTDYSSRKIALERFLLYCQGGRAAAEGSIVRSVIYFLTVGARSLLMGKRFKTVQFTKGFLTTWFN